MSASTVSSRVSIPRPAAKKKRKAKPLPLLPAPHACSVLGVDGAALSGWSIWTAGVLQTYGECDVFGDAPKEVLRLFMERTPAPHVVVIERPFLIRFGNQAGLAVGERIWRELVKRQLGAKRVVRVYPSTWRAQILGGKFVSAPRVETQAEEHARARDEVIGALGDLVTPQAPRIGNESAPAILIGKFGSYAQQTTAALPKPRKRKGAA